MSTQHALLAAIRMHPDEDTPRLAYADWLDENGDAARAEFIRVQIKLARYPDAAPEDVAQWRTRERELLRAHAYDESWHEDTRCELPKYERGFQISKGAHYGSDMPYTIYETQAGLQRLLLDNPEAARILRIERPENTVSDVLNCPGLEHLQGLAMNPTPEALDALCAPEVPQRLKYLSLWQNDAMEGRIGELLAAPLCRDLQVLQLSGDILPEDVDALCEPNVPQRLQGFSAGCNIGGNFARILKAPLCSELRSLALFVQNFSAADWDALCSPEVTQRFRHLGLSNTGSLHEHLDTHFGELLAAPCARELEALDVVLQEPEDLVALCNAPVRLRQVQINGSRIVAGHVIDLLDAPSLKGVRSLAIAGCNLGRQDLQALCEGIRAGKWPEIEKVYTFTAQAFVDEAIAAWRQQRRRAACAPGEDVAVGHWQGAGEGKGEGLA